MTDTRARLTTALAERYRIEREHGAGGLATIYLARDLQGQTLRDRLRTVHRRDGTGDHRGTMA